MPSAFWIRIVIGLAAANYLLLAYVFGVSVEEKWLQWLGGVIFAVIALLTVFDLYLWRWLPTSWTRRPNLDGTWKAELSSTWIDDESGRTISKECYLVIRQTFSTIRVTSLYDVSRSTSSVATITCPEGTYELSYIYWSVAGARARDDSNPAHRGACILLVSTKPKTRIEGEYWTDRSGTKGEITAVGYSRKHFETYRDASRAAYDPLAD